MAGLAGVPCSEGCCYGRQQQSISLLKGLIIPLKVNYSNYHLKFKSLTNRIKLGFNQYFTSFIILLL